MGDPAMIACCAGRTDRPGWPLPPWWCAALALAVLGRACVAGAEPAEAPERRIELCAPLTTIVHARHASADPERLEATLVVPEDAPADLGVGAFVADAHGRWFRSVQTRALAPGRHRLAFALGDGAGLIGEPHRAAWTASARATVADAGLFLWSQGASRAAIVVERLELVAGGSAAAAPQAAAQLRDLRIAGFDARAGVARGRTGERWTLDVTPAPFPDQPYRQECFALAAVIGAPDGRTWRIDGFYRQPLAIADRGDGESCTPTAAGCYEVRFRPGLPGRYTVRLEATWAGRERPLAVALPDLVVDGDPWDDYVRVDPADARFLSTGSRIGAPRFYWPVGLNLHSVWDTLSHDSFGTRLTPHRLWSAYEAYLRRFAAHGGTAVEIWLASWSLSLEWRGDWDGFHGIGRYSEENAERLDRVLDLAWRLGIRVNLVVNNHGQVSTDEDREWDDNPYNAALGGRWRGPRSTSPIAARWTARSATAAT
jgi:hypothetical protein